MKMGDNGMRWQVGKVTITQLVEIETLGGKEDILPQATPRGDSRPRMAVAALCRRGRESQNEHPLVPDRDADASDHQSTPVSETTSKAVATRPGTGRKGPFLQQIAAAGCPAETIDTVLCTHLHVDHVGWNTKLVDRRWVPTFPHARYLMGRVEFDHWSARSQPGARGDFRQLDTAGRLRWARGRYRG